MVRAILIDDENAKNKVDKSRHLGAFYWEKMVKIRDFTSVSTDTVVNNA